MAAVLLNNSANIRIPTTTALTSSLNPSLVGQPVTLTATVSSGAGVPPNGENYHIQERDRCFGNGLSQRRGSSVTTSTLPAGTSTITASYGGDTTFATSTSAGLRQVTTKYATATALVASLNPALYGQKVTWTATVTSSGRTPTGPVSFTWDGIHTIGAAPLNGSGVATLTRANLSAYSYPLTAVYLGDANNDPGAVRLC